jgi:hypothetical protein
MEQLYASYPASAAVRTGAQLVGVLGPMLLGLVATAGAVAWLDAAGALGSPRLWVLGAGLLVLLLGGAAGLAIGNWLRHPIAGLLAVLVLGLIELDLVLSVANPVHLPGGLTWLFPWSDPGSLLTMLPGLTVPFPPPAHLAELVALSTLAASVALWRLVRRRSVVAGVAIAAVAVACWSGWAEGRPVPASTLATLVRQATGPQGVQDCQPLGGVRYCYYPAFAPQAGQWAAVVGGVLARLPRPASRRLTVRQVDDEQFLVAPLLAPTSLTSIMSAQSPLSERLSRFDQALSDDTGLLPGSGGQPVYTDLSWGASGTALALAVSTAAWATGLPTTGRYVAYHNAGGSGSDLLACVPAGQARAAIALWLAAGATAATRAGFMATGTYGPGATEVGRTWAATVELAESGPGVGLTVPEQASLLAAEMIRLPAAQVTAALGPRWRYWLSPRTGLAALASALRLRLPAAPAVRPTPVSWATNANGSISDPAYNPPSPACT